MGKSALIFGVGGQDGSYLADILLEKGYQVYGTTRRSSVDNLTRITHCKDKLAGILRVEATDARSIERAILDTHPDEIYWMIDQDNVGWSNDIPGYSIDVTIKGVTYLLEAAKHYARAKVFLPVSATIYGDAPSPQYEGTPHNPLSPYACAKLSVYHLARYYRQVHGLWVSTGILYNHDSSRRGKGYVLQDIYWQMRKIAEGYSNVIEVKNADQYVDVGCAREFMEGAYRILQYNLPTDMILSSGRKHRIGSIIHELADHWGLTGYVIRSVAPVNPLQSVELHGDCSRAREMIDWHPQYDAIETIKLIANERG